MLIMAVLIAVSLYFKGSDLQTTEQSLRPISPPEQALRDNKSQKIDQLTAEKSVVSYVEKYQRLPEFYITKKVARQNGWNPRVGNLCEVMPGKAIGGDKFLNREKRLPIAPHRQWYEADINYRCGHRGADRLLYSSDGMIYLSKDHYKSFNQVK